MKSRIEYLKAHLDNTFFKSLYTQWEQRGTLSDRQIACIDRAIAKESRPVFSIQVGQKFEIKTWLAKRLQKETDKEFFFRNLEVIEVQKETEKAYLMSVRFVSSIACSCHVCGRALDNEVSRATGIGPVCADRLNIPRPTLANAQETLAQIDTLCKQIGTVGPFWVPKSQIKKHL